MKLRDLAQYSAQVRQQQEHECAESAAHGVGRGCCNVHNRASVIMVMLFYGMHSIFLQLRPYGSFLPLRAAGLRTAEAASMQRPPCTAAADQYQDPCVSMSMRHCHVHCSVAGYNMTACCRDEF